MKTTISSLLFSVLFSFCIDAQNRAHPSSYCGTPAIKSEWLSKFQRNIDSYEKSDVILYVPIMLHLVGTDDGEGYFSLKSALDQLCQLNQEFEEAEIQFYLDGLNYINNTTWYRGNQFLNMMNTHNVDNTLNCYIIGIDDFGGFYSVPGDAIAIAKEAFVSSFSSKAIFSHEVGHYLSLLHTFLGWENAIWNFSTPAPAFMDGVKVERVDGVDCDIAGDGFCDTKPDYLGTNYFPYFCNGNEESFIVQRDPTGASFRTDCSLIMSYSLNPYRFSEQQISAMRANIEQVRPYLLDNQNPLSEIPELPITLTYPPQAAMVDAAMPLSLEWDSVANATHYVVELTFLPEFSAVYDYYVAEGTSLTIDNLLPNKNYLWRVRPYNPFYSCNSFCEEGKI